MCQVCLKSLRAGKVPENTLVNFQYYAYDELPVALGTVFKDASLFDLMMVARAQMTKISYLFNHNIGTSDETSQGFI